MALDLLILGVVLAGIAILPSFVHGGSSLASLLESRLSLRNGLLALVCLGTWLLILGSGGVYTPARNRSLTDYLFRCMIGLNSCTAVVGLIVVALNQSADAWRTVAVYWLCCLLLMALSRAALLAFDRMLRPAPRRPRHVLIVGTGERAHQVAEELKAHREWNSEVVGFIDSEPLDEPDRFIPAEQILGGIAQLEQILQRAAVDQVIIALPLKSQHEMVGRAIGICQMLGVPSQYSND